MAWRMHDDLTDELITASTGGGDFVVGVDGDEYDFHLTTANQTKVRRELAVLLSRGRPRDDAPAVAAPSSDDLADTADDDVVFPDFGGVCPIGPDMDTVGPDVEPDARTRAEELLEQGWTPAQIVGVTGLGIAEVREIGRDLVKGAKT